MFMKNICLKIYKFFQSIKTCITGEITFSFIVMFFLELLPPSEFFGPLYDTSLNSIHHYFSMQEVLDGKVT